MAKNKQSKHQDTGQKLKPTASSPFEVRRGSVTVRGRFSPVQANGLWYDSWIVEYSLHGKRIRERSKTEREARTCAEAAATKLADGEILALELRGEDRRIYLAALEHLKGLEVRLDVAAQEYADAKKCVANADLRTVATFHQKYARANLKQITVPELVEEMIRTLGLDKRGDYHIRDLSIRLGRFAADFRGQISDVTTGNIENWLRGLTSLAKGTKRGGPLKGRSRNNYRNAIVELFNFARKHNYLPKDISTEATSTNRVSEADRRKNEIFEPTQMDELLNGAPPRLVPGMAIKAFSGMRTEEIAELKWEHIKFSENGGYLILPLEITKKNVRRIIPLLPNLRKWIEPFKGLTGRICYRWSTPQSMFQAWDRLAKKLGIKAGANRFRNSYISYRIAQVSDAEKVSLESGNSPRVIMTDYREVTTEEAAEEWFNVVPSPRQLKALEKYAKELRRLQQKV